MKNLSSKRRAEAHVFDAKQAKMLQQVQEDFPSKANHFKKAYGGSLRAAITAKCLECVWGETRAIRECTATSCPLHACRPYQEARAPRNLEKTATQSETEEAGHGNKTMV